MPWTCQRYPASIRHLGQAIRIAIAQAEEWARRHGLPLRDDEA